MGRASEARKGEFDVQVETPGIRSLGEPFRRAGRTGRSAEVCEAIRRLIVLGEVPPGAPLLELEIAEQFRCSQGTVREALLALQEEGLVHRQAHRGTRVSECTEAEAVEMFRLRHAIETRGLARGFARIDARLIRVLEGLVEAMEAAAREGDEYLLSEHDRVFHRRLFAAAELPAVEPILYRCLVHNHRFKITRSGAERNLVETARRHWTILDAIRAGDRDASIAAIDHHIATIVDFGPALFSNREIPDG